MVWIYVLKTKEHTFEAFKTLKTIIENPRGRKIKTIRTNNNLEFSNKEFTDLCKESGIVQHLTALGNPRQNGLVERMNRTLLERVRCMLFHANLSKAFWGEAGNTAAYVLNRSPLAAIEFKTSYEKWTCHKPSLKHLRVFGCIVYAHVKQGKLEPRAHKCIFIGCPVGVKGYKLWSLEPKNQRIIVTRDVIFYEKSVPKRLHDNGSKEPTSTIENVDIEW